MKSLAYARHLFLVTKERVKSIPTIHFDIAWQLWMKTLFAPQLWSDRSQIPIFLLGKTNSLLILAETPFHFSTTASEKCMSRCKLARKASRRVRTEFLLSQSAQNAQSTFFSILITIPLVTTAPEIQTHSVSSHSLPKAYIRCLIFLFVCFILWLYEYVSAVRSCTQFNWLQSDDLRSVSMEDGSREKKGKLEFKSVTKSQRQ